MSKLPQDYVERVYAGWLGKIIGVRHGSNIEGWTYERIKEEYGEIDGYQFDFKNFAADDDTNGPIFFIRALQDYTHTTAITPEQIGLTWLNYAPYEHGFFWWGGYGNSTEHTAYLNLKSGVPAPYSGSLELNGSTVAEQIGGQIFIDTWGLVVPGNPELAADYAQKAASVSHGGNGIYGGMFVAACISAAFADGDIKSIIQKGLAVIPSDCEYTRMANDVIAFYHKNPGDWHQAFAFVKQNYGYDRYPGACHIIPNSAVIILSLLYGEGDFSRSINICNMCGWDTDCNVANVGAIVGVMVGLEGIDYQKWRKPINDFLACSSTLGSLNIMDIPGNTYYLADLGYKIAGEIPPATHAPMINGQAPKFNFELPGSTHAFRVEEAGGGDITLENCRGISATGSASLKIQADTCADSGTISVYHQTYYRPHDFNDDRYAPSFTPQIFPGQTITARVMVPNSSGGAATACLYAVDGNSQEIYLGQACTLADNSWQDLSLTIPPLSGACIEKIGVRFQVGSQEGFVGYLDSMDISGGADYTLDFSRERMEVWRGFHKEVSQCSYHKGIWQLDGGNLSGSCSDKAELYTGGYDFADYTLETKIIPQFGENHFINFRVQGAIRSYAAGLAPNGQLALLKNENGYRVLASTPCSWQVQEEYTIKVCVKGAEITVACNGTELLHFTDTEQPYLTGQIGACVQNGSHCHYAYMKVQCQ